MYFIFKGIKSTEMGVTVLTQPPIKSPESRTWDSFIDNKDGADSLFLGYKPIELTMEIAVEGKENLDKVLGWLDGEGQLIRSDFPDRYRNVHIVEGIELNMIHPELWQGSFTYLVVDPYWYKVGDEWTEVRTRVKYFKGDWTKALPFGTEGKETKAPVDVFNKEYNRNLVTGTSEEFREELIKMNSYNATIVPLKDISHYGLVGGEEVTLTIHIKNKSSQGVGARIEYYNTDSDRKTFVGNYIYNGEGNSVITTEVLKGYSHLRIMVQPNPAPAQEDIEIEYKEVKLERGSKSTPWVPAWEDFPDKDKPVRAWDNMFLYAQDLNNGYYRVRVTGGNIPLKCLFSIDTPGKNEYRSVLMDVRAITPVTISTQFNTEAYGAGEEGLFRYQAKGNDYANYQVRIQQTKGEEGLIDLIVSSPHVYYTTLDSIDYAYSTTEEEVYSNNFVYSPKGQGYYRANLDRTLIGGEVEFKADYTQDKEPNNILTSLYYEGTAQKMYPNKAEGKEFTVSRSVKMSPPFPIDNILFYKDSNYTASSNIEAVLGNVTVTNKDKRLITSPGHITNEGNTKSYPIIHLKNNSKDTNVVRLNINDSIIRYEFPQGETEVFINLMGMRAGTEPTHTGYYRHDVRDKYLYVERDKGMHLNPGPNTITSDGDVEIKLLRKDRWI